MTRLVGQTEQPSTLMPRQETDATSALTQGIAEYMASLELDWPGTGMLRFAKATSTWAEYEQAENVYPRCFAGTAGADGMYDGGLGQDDALGDVLGGPPLPSTGGVILDSFEELVVPVTLEIFCSNPEQRRGVCAMVESALRPYRGRSGFQLELPHYFNARSTHTALRMTHLDNEEDAARNYRLARVVIQSRVPVIVMHRKRPVRAIERSSAVVEAPLTVGTPTVRRGQ